MVIQKVFQDIVQYIDNEVTAKKLRTFNLQQEKYFANFNLYSNGGHFSYHISVPPAAPGETERMGIIYMTFGIPFLLSNFDSNITINVDNGSFCIKSMNHNETVSFDEGFKLIKKILDAFIGLYINRKSLIEYIIKSKYHITDLICESIFVKFNNFTRQYESDFEHSYFIDKERNIVYLEDFSGTNTRSILNGLEELATEVYIKHQDILQAPENIKWINIFCNFNERGIIFDELQLAPSYLTTGYWFWKKKFFQHYPNVDYTDDNVRISSEHMDGNLVKNEFIECIKTNYKNVYEIFNLWWLTK